MRKFLLAAALCLAGGSAWAGTANSWITPQIPELFIAQINNAATTTPQALATAATTGTIVKGVTISNTDTSAYSVQLSVLRSAVSYLVCTVSVPISAGNTTAAPAAAALTSGNCPGLPLDPGGNPYILLKSGDVLQINTTGTVASNKLVTAIGVGYDF
jgi:hypothetical protein